jgi:fatty acid desaturase
MKTRLRFPLLFSAKISYPELWYIFESNNKVIHYRLLELSIIQRDQDKALQIIIGWLAITIAWIGVRIPCSKKEEAIAS